MQAPVELMWEAIDKKEFNKLSELIKDNPKVDFINAVNQKNGRTLPMHLLQITKNKKEAKPRELLNCILSHPNMNWEYEHNKETAVSCLLEVVGFDKDFTVIESLSNVKGFILNNKLTYEVATLRLKELEDTLQLRINLKKPQSIIDASKVSVETCKAAVALIRDITILYAIKTDDADLFERLYRAGGEPLENLGDFGNKKITPFLFGRNQPNPRLRAWQSEIIAKETANRPEELKAMKENLDRWGMFQSQVNQINATCNLNNLALHDQFKTKQDDIIQRALAVTMK